MERNSIGGRRLTNPEEVAAITRALDASGYDELASRIYLDYWGFSEGYTFDSAQWQVLFGDITLGEPKDYIDLNSDETELAFDSLRKIMRGEVLSGLEEKMEARKMLFAYHEKPLRFYRKVIGRAIDTLRPGII